MRVGDESKNSNFPFDLEKEGSTLDIMFLFFIFSLLRILTATGVPVSRCLPSKLCESYP